MIWLRRRKDRSNERLKKDTSDKLIEAVESELTDVERRIELSKAKFRALILKEKEE